MHDHDTNFYDFVALHAATIKKYKLKNYVIGTEVNQNFGRTYIRIVAFSVRNENVHISYGGNCGYFSTTIKSKDRSFYIKDKNERYDASERLQRTFDEISNNLNFMVGILKAAFPKLNIINHTKSYSVPYDYKYGNEITYDTPWYQEKENNLLFIKFDSFENCGEDQIAYQNIPKRNSNDGDNESNKKTKQVKMKYIMVSPFGIGTY
ncbi:MAG: hypothetical protein HC836_35355 [Richelia sp. RM2_1_2]|nr:hypothetical protein [Richelia sp. RM2_1_2]